MLFRSIPRSSLQAITHVDFSARVQSVSSRDNPKFHALLPAFKDLTGCGVLVNTSFNVRDEPIVCTPEDAYRCFMNTGMDDLVMGNYLFSKIQKYEKNKYNFSNHPDDSNGGMRREK